MSVVNYKNDNKYKVGNKVIIKKLNYNAILQNDVRTGFVDYMKIGGRIETIREITLKSTQQGLYKIFRLTDGFWYVSWQFDSIGIQEIEI